MPAKRLFSAKEFQALAEVMSAQYAPVYRIAVGLTGDLAMARLISRKVLGQSLRIYWTWETQSDVPRWFAHHTVLLSRQLMPSDLSPNKDAMLSLTADPGFQTIFRTLRKLPPQHREAFFLHHAQGLDLRQLATAMDCSTQATSNHLVAATEALRGVGADRLGEFTAILPQLLAQIVPPPETIRVEVRRQVNRYLWPRRFKLWVGLPLLIAGIVALTWFGWKFWQMLVI